MKYLLILLLVPVFLTSKENLLVEAYWDEDELFHLFIPNDKGETHEYVTGILYHCPYCKTCGYYKKGDVNVHFD